MLLMLMIIVGGDGELMIDDEGGITSESSLSKQVGSK